jgi:predicted RNase H-like HicB family nuclease
MSGTHETRKYLVVAEQAADGSFSPYVPVLPGRVSCARSLEELRQSIREAIELHSDRLWAEGLDVPDPHSAGDYALAAV